jgi:hypothetical protein
MSLKVLPGTWNDYYIDLRGFPGNKITLTISGKSNEPIVLGASGPSIGEREEDRLIHRALTVFWEERDGVRYIGNRGGLFLYENTDCLSGAFLVSGHASDPFMPERAIRVDNAEQPHGLNSNPGQFEVDCPHEGLLVLPRLYYPGWRAYIDDKETAIKPFLNTFMAIEVPEGAHQIRLTYRPSSFYLGVLLSLLSFCALVFFQVIKKDTQF